MNICMICPTYPPNDIQCGIGDYTRSIVQTLMDRGLEIDVIASARCHAQSSTKLKIHAVTEDWSLRSIFKLLRFFRSRQIDLVHLQFAPHLYEENPSLLALPLFLSYRSCPFITSFHAFTGSTHSSLLLGPLLLALSKHAIITNEEITATIKQKLPFLQHKTTFIPIGPNIRPKPIPTDACKIKKALGIPQDIPIITHFGLIYPGKGLETLLHSLTILKAHGVDFRLLIIGGTITGQETDYSRTLSKLVYRLKLDHFVIWLGYCSPEEVSDYLYLSDIYAIPYDEGFSLRRGTYLAGLFHKLPIISTYPVVKTAYVTGQDVLFIPPRDPEALSDALLALIRSPYRRQKFKRQADHLINAFSWDSIGEQTICEYTNLVPMRRGARFPTTPKVP